MRLVLPFGIYYAANTGDEATLNGLARLLGQNGYKASSTWVGTRNPEQMPRAEPSFGYFSTQRRDFRRVWAKMLGSAYAVVGGTPIQDALGDWPLGELTGVVRAVERRKAPLAFIGVGVENLHCGKKRALFASEIAPRVGYWTPRSSKGRERLIEYGVPSDRITAAADLAWLIEPATPDFGRERLQAWGVGTDRPLLGVNIAYELFDETPSLVATVAAALDAWVEQRNGRVVFFVNDVSEIADRDLAAARRIMEAMKHAGSAQPVPNEYFTPRQMMSLIGCCEQALSTHYHFCVYSALQGVPFLAMHHTDKVLDLCADMGLDDLVVRPESAASTLRDANLKLQENLSSVRTRVTDVARRMRELASRNLVGLQTLATR